MRRYFTIITLLLICFDAHAGLNKWVDADGKVHYSDSPPPNVETERVRSFTGKEQADAPVKYSPKSIAEREAEYKKSKQEKEKALQEKSQENAEAAAKKRNCEAAQENLRTLESGSRVVTYDANGERIYLDDTARAQKLEEARTAISKSCN